MLRLASPGHLTSLNSFQALGGALQALDMTSRWGSEPLLPVSRVRLESVSCEGLSTGRERTLSGKMSLVVEVALRLPCNTTEGAG